MNNIKKGLHQKVRPNNEIEIYFEKVNKSGNITFQQYEYNEHAFQTQAYKIETTAKIEGKIRLSFYSEYKDSNLYLIKVNYEGRSSKNSEIIYEDITSERINGKISGNTDSLGLFLLTNKNLQNKELPIDFNANTYRLLNSDLLKLSNQQLEEHYLKYGIKENRNYKINLPENFCYETYRELNKDLCSMNKDQLIVHYIDYGFKENRKYKLEYEYSNEYVEMDKSEKYIDTKIRVIAHYFPQYHPIPENDKWWGEGFTDWVNVKKAKPLFEQHYQPHIPDEFLGYYNLTDTDVQKKQIELAKKYGIYGFCFYTYWFNGKRLLEKPLDNYLENKELDLPFCICWANENWTRRWDGLDNDILINQNYSEDDDIEFIKKMSEYLKDSRYIKINNTPLLMIYRPDLFPNIKETVARWRHWCRKNDIGEIYLVYPQSFSRKNPTEYGFDAASEFPPASAFPEPNTDKPKKSNSNERKYCQKFSYNYLIDNFKNDEQKYKLFKCVLPSWDNTPRKQNRGDVFLESEPAKFQEITENAFSYTLNNHSGEERIVFVNAWNEWAEGCHLEPDKKYGYGWLEAIKNAHIFTGDINKNLVEKVNNLGTNSTFYVDEKLD